MSITVLSDVVISNQVLDAGIRGKNIRKNRRVEVASGYEFVNIEWTRSLREYEFGTVPLRRTDWLHIEALFEVTEGGAYGFLLQDPKDSTAVAADGVVAGPLTGAPNTFQLFKRYTEPVSGRTKDRKITRPRSVQAYVSGVPTASSFDATNGHIEVSGATDASLVTWAGSFYVPVHFVNDEIDWELVVAGPSPDARFYTGPSVVVREILEGAPVV